MFFLLLFYRVHLFLVLQGFFLFTLRLAVWFSFSVKMTCTRPVALTASELGFYMGVRKKLLHACVEETAIPFDITCQFSVHYTENKTMDSQH